MDDLSEKYKKRILSMYPNPEEKLILPMWEIKTEDLVYVLVCANEGHEVYWFEDGSSFAPQNCLYRRIHHIESSEDALFWLIGNVEWSALAHGEARKIIKFTRIGDFKTADQVLYGTPENAL